MKKRIFTLALALLVMSLAVPAAAAEITSPGTGSTDMTYNVASTYTVTISPSVTIDPSTKAGTLTVGVEANAFIAHNTSILVKLTVCDFKLTNNDDNLTYTITDDSSAAVALNGTVLTHAAGNLEASSKELSIAVTGIAKYSGNYTDQITFTVSVE